MDLLVWLEQTALAAWVRESTSLWAYPTILFMHTLGMSMAAGLSSALDLRILGFGRDISLSPLERLFPFIWIGFWINAFSGSLLLIADATTKLTNPVFFVKMFFVILAIVDLQIIRNKIFRNPLVDKAPIASTGRALAILSLICWVGAITAGRLMAYLGPVSGLQ